MKLLYTKRSPYARKVHILAIEKNLSLEFIEEDLAKKSAVLLKSNPMGKIPALILDNGECLFDNPVICEYLDALNDTPVLIPRQGKERFEVLCLAAVGDGLMDTAIVLYMEKTRHPEGFHQVFVDNQQETLKNCLTFYENNISRLKELSLASIAAAVAVGYINFRLPHLNPPGQYKNLSAWFAEFSKRPSMVTTVPTA